MKPRQSPEYILRSTGLWYQGTIWLDLPEVFWRHMGNVSRVHALCHARCRQDPFVTLDRSSQVSWDATWHRATPASYWSAHRSDSSTNRNAQETKKYSRTPWWLDINACTYVLTLQQLLNTERYSFTLILDESYLQHYILLVECIWLLLQDSITDENLVDAHKSLPAVCSLLWQLVRTFLEVLKLLYCDSKYRDKIYYDNQSTSVATFGWLCPASWTSVGSLVLSVRKY